MAMTTDDYRHYVCIVAGENPEKMIRHYDATIEVAPYVKYKKGDADKLRMAYIKAYEGYLKNLPEDWDYDLVKDTIEDLQNMSSDEFFDWFCKGMDKDEEGNALTTVNPDGKFRYCNVGKMFCVPFIDNEGKEVYQARKKDIDWNRIHGANKELYRSTWEMVMEDSTPQSDNECVIYKNMHDKVGYLNKFETKENYVTSSTAFWGYAFLSDTTGWMDANDTPSQFEWMSNYYDVFIKLLPEDTLLTIYECHI